MCPVDVQVLEIPMLKKSANEALLGLSYDFKHYSNMGKRFISFMF